jgi:protein-tyrosine-phosphatase
LAERLLSSVLFLCGRNAVRSPIALAVAQHYFPDLYVQSAGILPGARDPFVDTVLAEIGLDLDDHRPHGLADLEDLNFDLAVTLSPLAHHAALELTRTQAIEVEYWATADPTLIEGSRERILDAYRLLRDGLSERIRRRFSA